MKIIRLQATRQESEKTKKIRGVEFHVALSPYLFPERIEVDYRADTGCFYVDFKYLDEEAGEDLPDEVGVVRLTVGKKSRKLLRVTVEVDRHNVDQLGMSIVEIASQAIERQQATDPVAENYKIAQEAISQHREEIEKELVTA